MTLHLVNQSPQHTDVLRQCLSVCQSGDTIVLLDDGLSLLGDRRLLEEYTAAHPRIRWFALVPGDDSQHLRQDLQNPIQLIDFKGLVNLTIDCHPAVSW